MDDAAARRVRRAVVIRGTVQAVGFRWATRAEARRLGLAGWVSNRADGRVEAEFEGEPERVEAMLAWCRRGPRMAEVIGIEVSELEPRDEDEFEIV